MACAHEACSHLPCFCECLQVLDAEDLDRAHKCLFALLMESCCGAKGLYIPLAGSIVTCFCLEQLLLESPWH